MPGIYYCTKENNTCPKKESCKRYIEADNNPCITLFKMMCTKDNNYLLYIKAEVKELYKN